MRQRSNRTNANPPVREAGNQPNWVVKTPKEKGRSDRLERVGAAWDREDGGICIRLVGTQIVTEDLYLYPIEDNPDQAQ